MPRPKGTQELMQFRLPKAEKIALRRAALKESLETGEDIRWGDIVRRLIDEYLELEKAGE